eukprot:TRINITY_DN1008_c0_g2_i7.p1 TRINITY_DN1008_c0_g2~~TRINITY_DN1008_c0_g2_i7.p1  ORF type:complete len:3819 (+),score=1555.84 TRINITY_DN1008_c0_g2_i7:2346-13802(+)
MQEAKFKGYYDNLQHMLREHDRVMDKISRVYLKLMKFHIEDLNESIAPGLTTLTWTSLNIDHYLGSIKMALDNIEELVTRANDIIDYSVDSNLAFISRSVLVTLPFNETWSVDEFVTKTKAHVKVVSAIIDSRSEAIEKQLNELVKILVDGYTMDQRAAVEHDIRNLFYYYNRLNFEALLACMKRSLNMIKKRFQPARKSFLMGGILFPLFRVNVELAVPNVVMNPSLEDIQEGMNKACIAILSGAKNVYCWGQDRTLGSELRSLYPNITSKKDIVKVVLLMTGSIEHLRNTVHNYLETFTSYDYLWTEDKALQYRSFVAEHGAEPPIDQFELKIQEYETKEMTINNIPMNHNIGCLSLESSKLKDALRSEASGWKEWYGAELHKLAKIKMEDLQLFLEDAKLKLNREIKDLDDVKPIMEALAELREMETLIDMQISPIEEAYGLLQRYHIPVHTKDEGDIVDELRGTWIKMKAQALAVEGELLNRQPDFRANLIKDIKTFDEDVKYFKMRYDDRGPMVHGISAKQAIERLRLFDREFEDKKIKWEKYNMGEELFGMPITRFHQLEVMQDELKKLRDLYNLYEQVEKNLEEMAKVLWHKLNVEDAEKIMATFQARARDLPRVVRQWNAYKELGGMITGFLETLPLLAQLKHRSIRPRHWTQLMTVSSSKFPLDKQEFKLHHLLDIDILKYAIDVEDIYDSAIREASIENALDKIREDWEDQQFFFDEYKGQANMLLKSPEIQDTITLLDESQLQISQLVAHPNNEFFKTKIDQWVNKLDTVRFVIDKWLVVQNSWTYLEAVFGGGDISSELPKETKKFQQINKQWTKIMNDAVDNPNVISLCTQDENLQTLLPHLIGLLEQCQRRLDWYLELKRGVFSRFYFVSDMTMLEVLGNASDTHNIQKHVEDVFYDNIKYLTFESEHSNEPKLYNRITHINDETGENIELSMPVIADKHVEDWLNVLIESMQETMKDIIRDAACNLEMDLKEVIEIYQSQVALLWLQLRWTRDAENALSRAKSEKSIMNLTKKEIDVTLKTLIDLTNNLHLSKLRRRKIETMITIQMHQRDVFDTLKANNIRTPKEFDWLKQTRFYWLEDEDECVVRITNVDFVYAYEYSGAKDRLVITDLTDRCYITLAQAIGLHLGGAPAGPAGTGKTETVKDMGKALGKYVVVFNCSDSYTIETLGRIFKGIAHCGCWGDFDEFNRIKLPVLSVAAQQIQSVLTAKREKAIEFQFSDGTIVPLTPGAGMFITMNPGYAGRQELPENLKIQFRTVAMMVPDRRAIMKVKLAAAGFQQTDLPKKFDTLYKLSEQQLSKQNHYDFGLRNILSVLRTCGHERRSHPEESETSILMRVLRDMNLSKLVDEDEELFDSLITDLFPNIKVSSNDYSALQGEIQAVTEKRHWINYPAWNRKCIQLYETQLVRHGIMVLGPSGCGKTSAITTVREALSGIGEKIEEERINPKAISHDEMFGRQDIATGDWINGIFSQIWMNKSNDPRKNVHLWIVLDGPVDAVWIEDLNTVLDDNKTLTLSNGERKPMPPTMKLIFEVDNLEHASPATVSRNGMIYVSETSLGWKPYFEAYLMKPQRLPEQNGERLAVIEEAFVNLCDPLMTLVTEELQNKTKVFPLHQVQVACDLLTALLPANKQFSEGHVRRAVTFAVAWGLGGLLSSEQKRIFHQALMQVDNVDVPQSSSDEEGTVFEYFVNEGGEWQHWDARVPDWEYNPATDFRDIVVPTVDNVRMHYLIDLIWSQQKAVMLIGEPGSAKTVILNNFLDSKRSHSMLTKVMNFSFTTTPSQFQNNMENSVEKRPMRHTWGPVGQSHMTVLVDDINMPRQNRWGDQETNEIVRQLIEERGFRDKKDPGEWAAIQDVQFLAAMRHPGGGVNDIPARLKRHFAIFNCTMPEDASIDRINGLILEGFFSGERGFNNIVQDTVTKLAVMTRRLWQNVKGEYLSKPDTFHYVFNLRDMSRVAEGLLNVTPEVVKSEDGLFSLWWHECCRVFQDRFTNEADIERFTQLGQDMLIQEFHMSSEQMNTVTSERLWVDFMRKAELEEDEDEYDIQDPKIYEPADSFVALQTRLLEFQGRYKSKTFQLDLVFFDDAIRHLARISRILRTPGGNALLVGVGGSGKQSLTRLASFIAGAEVHTLHMTRTYNQTNLEEDIKELYLSAGLHNQQVVFIFTDNDVKEESFLETINNLLTSGDIPNLFARDEREAVITELGIWADKNIDGFEQTPENVWQLFMNRVRNQLHLVLCMSPVGEQLRSRSQKFPGIVSGCTIDWFLSWQPEALIKVAEKYLDDFEVETSADTKTELVQHVALVHDMVNGVTKKYFDRFRRQVYVTPKSYLSFLDSFKNVYGTKHRQLSKLAQNMENGLAQLKQAEVKVTEMKGELKEQEAQLSVAQAEVQERLKEITKQTASATTAKQEVERDRDLLMEQAAKIDADKQEAEKSLASAKPALDRANEKLSKIKESEISPLRNMASPPVFLQRLLDAVMILYQAPGLQKTVWEDGKDFIEPSKKAGKSMLSQSDFLKQLKGFKKEAINDETIELLQPYLRAESWTEKNANKASQAIGGVLYLWIDTMVLYQHVAKKVAPLTTAVEIAQRKLSHAMAKLHLAEEELADKQAHLDKIQAKYDQAVGRQRHFQDKADETRNNMNSATALIEGLGGERDRWQEQGKEFKAQIVRLVGDSALGSAFMSYAGPFNQDFRALLVESLLEDLTVRDIPKTDTLNVSTFLVTQNEVDTWLIEGLPNDEHSTQNAIVATASSRFPLIIDPQGQAKNWIKNREGKDLVVTDLDDKQFKHKIETALRTGSPVLIEDVGNELDPILDPVLEKNYIAYGRGKKKVQFGDTDVEVIDGFKLYITSNLSNPTYSPEVSAKCSVIDFAVVMKGLEDQLLSVVINIEKADLEKQRKALKKNVNENKKELLRLEKQLLETLSESDDLLGDPKLIKALQEAKSKSELIEETLANAEKMQADIDELREEYRPVATRGSILYFLIAEMSQVNPMYQTSLEQFLLLFNKSIDRAERNPFTEKRVNFIINELTRFVFTFISRGLYKLDKQVFSLQLALKIDMNVQPEPNVTAQEYDILIKGGNALDINSVKKRPYQWIPETSWLNLVKLSELPQFQQILQHVIQHETSWNRWFTSEMPETEELPDGYEDKLGAFHRMLLVRCFTPDRTMLAAVDYIADSLDEFYTETVSASLSGVLEDTDERTPVIALLSAGADPSDKIHAQARKMKLPAVLYTSMGSKQDEKARHQIKHAQQNGGWVLLQNCHLGLDFVNKEVEGLIQDTEHVHKTFRLFMTTDPVHRVVDPEHPDREPEMFSINVLQMSIKMTDEPPEGLRAGLRRTYKEMSQDTLESVDMQFQGKWSQMLYVLCFLHSSVQERRKFGAIGWNIPYEFNQSDFTSSKAFVQKLLEDLEVKKSLPWSTIQYMITSVMYGGRVTDDKDSDMLRTYGELCLTDDIFRNNYCFFGVPKYSIPDSKNYKDYVAHIESLPGTDKPEVFGLHPNADILYRTREVDTILNTIQSVMPKEAGAMGGKTREEAVEEQALDYLNKLPQPFNELYVKQQKKKLGGTTPLNQFLQQEIDRMQRLIMRVRSNLDDLVLALKGTIVLSDDLIDIMNALYDTKVPTGWEEISWPSSSIGYWIGDVLNRTQQLTMWLSQGRPLVFTLGYFFNPQGFLTAVQQEITKLRQGLALDQVELHTEVLTKMREDFHRKPSEDSVFIAGMFLEGAAWDDKKQYLVDQDPKVLAPEMPVMEVKAVQGQSSSKNDPHTYYAPVYSNPARTDRYYIFDVGLRAGDATSHKWTLRGVALLTSTV